MWEQLLPFNLREMKESRPYNIDCRSNIASRLLLL